MSGGERMWDMDPTVRLPENLRKLAIIDDGFVEDQAWLERALDTALALEPKTAALPQLRASVAAGSPGCLEWSTEITGMLLAVALVNALSRAVAAAPEVVTALGYDIADAGRTNDH